MADEVVSKLAAAATSRSLSALTLAELASAAESLELLGTSSKAYSAAKACAQAGAYRTTTYGTTTVYMTLVSVLHDEDADGNALGLTWMLSAAAPSASYLMGSGNGVTTMKMNSSDTNTGGWGASAGRTTLNSTVLSNLTESGLTSLIKARKVPYGPTYSSTSASVSYTTDKLWLMSYHEVYGAFNAWQKSSWSSAERPWTDAEGEQMDWFSANGVSTSNYSKLAGGSTNRWLRSCYPSYSSNFGCVGYNGGNPTNSHASYSRAVFPCFSM